MDAFLGYNQIRMVPEDEEKTAFIIDKDMYYYKMVPFNLKNAGATYQCLINKVFQHQIDCNMKVYIDDILIKSMEADRHITNMEEAFRQLWRY